MMIHDEDLKYIYCNLSDEEKNKFKDATILITGCGGFLGYYFMHFFDKYAEKLSIKKVIGLDNFMLGKSEWINKLNENNLFEIVEFDIITDDISDVICSNEANFIIHMASIASPTFYRQYSIETLDANIWGLRRLFDFYKDKNIKGFLFF